jgi:hypothetical protein
MQNITRKQFIRHLVPALAVALLAACSSTPDNSSIWPALTPLVLRACRSCRLLHWRSCAPNSLLSKRSVHYDYDQYNVSPVHLV